MFLQNIYIHFAIILGCTALFSTASGRDSASPLQFVTITSAGGCPLTLYFPRDSRYSRDAFLSPAFCIKQNIETVLTTACPKMDQLLRVTYVSIPIAITDSCLLAEARETLKPLLQNRTLTFLQPLSYNAVGKIKFPILCHESDHGTGVLRVICRRPNCSDLRTQWDMIEQAEQEVTLQTTPGSKSITMKFRISISNRGRILTSLKSSSVLPAPLCKNLKPHKIISIKNYCRATVLQRTDRKGHFVIEPTLCYNGKNSSHFGEQGGVVRLTLEVKSDLVRDNVNRMLSHLSPLSVTFMSLVSADLQVSESLTNWSFETLRLAPDGGSAELQVRCNSLASCRLFISILQHSPTDLWRHVRFTIESQLETLCSWQNEVFAAPLTEANICVVNYLYQYDAINGLLCIKSHFVKQHLLLYDEDCAMMCSNTFNCQAFSTANTICELFLFNKCSKNVKDCSCSKRGRVFVKRQPGLVPGKLCPTGYGDDLCGVKYKVYDVPENWLSSKRKCESEKGLVIMADVMDKAEMSHIASVQSHRAKVVHYIWMGGFQTPGSVEPAGGWHWVGCNIPVNASLWYPGEPNNAFGNESAIEMHRPFSDLNDILMTHSYGHMCECVSPF